MLVLHTLIINQKLLVYFFMRSYSHLNFLNIPYVAAISQFFWAGLVYHLLD